jgi:hypothetical protein
MTATLNPYDLYRFDGTHNGTNGSLCADPSNCPEMKEQNKGRLTVSEYARFSRRLRNDHRAIPINPTTPIIDKYHAKLGDDKLTLSAYLKQEDVRTALAIPSDI